MIKWLIEFRRLAGGPEALVCVDNPPGHAVLTPARLLDTRRKQVLVPRDWLAPQPKQLTLRLASVQPACSTMTGHRQLWVIWQDCGASGGLVKHSACYIPQLQGGDSWGWVGVSVQLRARAGGTQNRACVHAGLQGGQQRQVHMALPCRLTVTHVESNG
jgi:hypothetical protein